MASAFSGLRSSLARLGDRISGGGGADTPAPRRSTSTASAGRGPVGAGQSHARLLPPEPVASPSPRKEDPGSAGGGGGGGGGGADLAALVGKLKRRADGQERKAATLREALALALACLDDASSVIEAVTGKPLAHYTVADKRAAPPAVTDASDPLLETLGSGVEAVLAEIAGLVRKGRAAAAAAVGRRGSSGAGVSSSSGGGGGGGGAPVAKPPPSAAQAPFPGRTLDLEALRRALQSAAQGAPAAAPPPPPSASLLSPPNARHTQLAATAASQSAQLRILTVELESTQRLKAEAEAGWEAARGAAAASASAMAALRSEAEALRARAAALDAALASESSAAQALRQALHASRTETEEAQEFLKESERAVRESLGEVVRVKREGDARAAELQGRVTAARGEVERAISRASHAERLATGNIERLNGDVQRLTRELKAARSAAAAAAAAAAGGGAAPGAALADAAVGKAAGADLPAALSPLRPGSAASASSGSPGAASASAGGGAPALGASLEEQLAQCNRELQVVQEELEDALTRVSLSQGQEAVLKGEVRSLSARLEALHSVSGGIPLTYLRNVVLQLGGFCERPSAIAERKNLLNVLATMLDFDEGERRRACVPPMPRKVHAGHAGKAASGTSARPAVQLLGQAVSALGPAHPGPPNTPPYFPSAQQQQGGGSSQSSVLAGEAAGFRDVLFSPLQVVPAGPAAPAQQPPSSDGLKAAGLLGYLGFV